MAARSTNNATASLSPSLVPSPSDNPGTGYTYSNGSRNRARLVARTVVVGQPVSNRSTKAVSPSTRCSQLSSTISAFAPANLATTVAVGDLPSCSPNPKALATAAPTIAGSVTGARSTYHAPAAYRSVTSVATARASRVLPTPPEPTAVTSRCRARSSASAARSAARPTNDVSGDGSDGGAVRRSASRSLAPSEAVSLASARRSGTSSLRSSDDTWLSTVRTEMTTGPRSQHY